MGTFTKQEDTDNLRKIANITEEWKDKQQKKTNIFLIIAAASFVISLVSLLK